MNLADRAVQLRAGRSLLKSLQYSVTVAVTAVSFSLAAPAADAQTLNVGVRAGPLSMDPHFSNIGPHAEALKHIFDTLVWAGDDLQIEPRLAESWTVVDDNTWEFKLRKIGRASCRERV